MVFRNNPTRRIHRKIERGFTYNDAGALTAYELITTYEYNAKGQVTGVDGPLPGSADRIDYTYPPQADRQRGHGDRSRRGDHHLHL